MKSRMHSEIAAEPTLAMFAKGQERSFEGGQPMSGFRSTADSVTQSQSDANGIKRAQPIAAHGQIETLV
jgi:hypothetical protein